MLAGWAGLRAPARPVVPVLQVTIVPGSGSGSGRMISKFPWGTTRWWEGLTHYGDSAASRPLKEVTVSASATVAGSWFHSGIVLNMVERQRGEERWLARGPYQSVACRVERCDFFRGKAYIYIHILANRCHFDVKFAHDINLTSEELWWWLNRILDAKT